MKKKSKAAQRLGKKGGDATKKKYGSAFFRHIRLGEKAIPDPKPEPELAAQRES